MRKEATFLSSNETYFVLQSFTFTEEAKPYAALLSPAGLFKLTNPQVFPLLRALRSGHLSGAWLKLDWLQKLAVDHGFESEEILAFLSDTTGVLVPANSPGIMFSSLVFCSDSLPFRSALSDYFKARLPCAVHAITNPSEIPDGSNLVVAHYSDPRDKRFDEVLANALRSPDSLYLTAFGFDTSLTLSNFYSPRMKNACHKCLSAWISHTAKGEDHPLWEHLGGPESKKFLSDFETDPIDMSHLVFLVRNRVRRLLDSSQIPFASEEFGFFESYDFQSQRSTRDVCVQWPNCEGCDAMAAGFEK